MSDLKGYIQKRKKKDKRFAKKYEEGYAEFKIGIILRNLREKAGLTQSELASALHTINLLFHALKLNLKIFVYLHYLKLQQFLENELESGLPRVH